MKTYINTMTTNEKIARECAKKLFNPLDDHSDTTRKLVAAAYPIILAALTAALAEQKRDGERLEFLLSHIATNWIECQWPNGDEFDLHRTDKQDYRAAIDAAMSKETKP